MNDRSASPSLPDELLAEGTRGRILERALQLFASEGFHGTSMRDLGKLVEVQASALYVHFPSKEHVLAELARRGHEAHHAALREALLAAGSAPADQLRAVVAANARFHASHPLLAIVVNDEMRALEGDLAAPALALRKQSTALLSDILRRGVASSDFSILDLGVTTAAIGAMGMRIPYWYEPDSGTSIEALAEAQADLALRMVGVRGTRRR